MRLFLDFRVSSIDQALRIARGRLEQALLQNQAHCQKLRGVVMLPVAVNVPGACEWVEATRNEKKIN
jgi:hypothetical protein